MSERLRQLLMDFARHVTSDAANTDEYLAEGMTFDEALSVMDHVGKAVTQYVVRETPL